MAACSTTDHPATANATNPAAPAVAAPTDQEIVGAWSYLYARYLVLRQENYDVNVEKVGYNRIKYNPLGSAQFVILTLMSRIFGFRAT